MFVILLAVSALAADSEPVITTMSDGTVVGTVHVEASPDAIKEMLADPAAAVRLAPEVLSAASALAPDGRCQLLEVRTQGLWNPLKYRAKVCPTSTGYSTELVDSDSFLALNTSWTITSADGGADVEFRVKSSIASIPDPLVRKGTERSMTQTLLALVKQAAGL